MRQHIEDLIKVTSTMKQDRVKKITYDEERKETKDILEVLKKESMWLRKEIQSIDSYL